MTIILDFLDLPWDSSVLHHQDFINKKGDSGIRQEEFKNNSEQHFLFICIMKSIEPKTFK